MLREANFPLHDFGASCLMFEASVVLEGLDDADTWYTIPGPWGPIPWPLGREVAVTDPIVAGTAAKGADNFPLGDLGPFSPLNRMVRQVHGARCSH